MRHKVCTVAVVSAIVSSSRFLIFAGMSILISRPADNVTPNPGDLQRRARATTRAIPVQPSDLYFRRDAGHLPKSCFSCWSHRPEDSLPVAASVNPILLPESISASMWEVTCAE
jgi:hypothetical protein